MANAVAIEESKQTSGTAKSRIDQTTQGVRFKGKFEDNYIIFISGSILRRL
jgi:hypothetical protein